MKKIKFLDLIYSLMVKYYQLISKIKQHLLISVILWFILLELVTNTLCRFNLFTQINLLSGILKYNQFWSLIDAIVAIVIPLRLRNPKIAIDWISTIAASDKPYGIYNRSNFGYMIEILGANVPTIPLFSKVRLLYKLRGNKSKEYYICNHIIDGLYNVYDHGYYIGYAQSNINKIEQKNNIDKYNKAEREHNYFLKILKCSVKQNYIRLDPYSVTFKSVYVSELDRALFSRLNKNKLLNYRLKHSEPCMYYIIFRTPKGKLFFHRSFYCIDVFKYEDGAVSKHPHYDYFHE